MAQPTGGVRNPWCRPETIALPLGEGGETTCFVSSLELFRLLLTVSLEYFVDFRDVNEKQLEEQQRGVFYRRRFTQLWVECR